MKITGYGFLEKMEFEKNSNVVRCSGLVPKNIWCFIYARMTIGSYHESLALQGGGIH